MFHCLATGYCDSTAYIRELTLKATLVIASKLKERTVNAHLLKHLSKLQVRVQGGAWTVAGAREVRGRAGTCAGDARAPPAGHLSEPPLRHLSDASERRVSRVCRDSVGRHRVGAQEEGETHQCDEGRGGGGREQTANRGSAW